MATTFLLFQPDVRYSALEAFSFWIHSGLTKARSSPSTMQWPYGVDCSKRVCAPRNQDQSGSHFADNHEIYLKGWAPFKKGTRIRRFGFLHRPYFYRLGLKCKQVPSFGGIQLCCEAKRRIRESTTHPRKERQAKPSSFCRGPDYG